MEQENPSNAILGALEEMLRKFLEKIIPKKKQYTPLLQFTDTVVIPGGGTVGTVWLKGPTKGRFWYVRKMRVSGITPATTAAGRADVFVGTQDLRGITALNQAPIAMWKDQAATIPLVASYGHGELRIASQEQVFIVFSGATAGQVYVASIEAFEYPDQDEEIEWVI